jgi:predicted GNAT family acetyltransferase
MNDAINKTLNEVRDNAAERRFELKTDAGTAFIAYHLEGDAISLDHTEVPSALEGRGAGSTLVRGTFALLRTRGQKMVPRCSFIAAYVQRHPEYHDLVKSQ